MCGQGQMPVAVQVSHPCVTHTSAPGLGHQLADLSPTALPRASSSHQTHLWFQRKGQGGRMRKMQSATARALPGQGRATQLATLPTSDSSFAHPHCFSKSPGLKWPIVEPWQRSEERSSSKDAPELCTVEHLPCNVHCHALHAKAQQLEHRHRCRLEAPGESGDSKSVHVLQIPLHPACLITGKL